MATINLYMVTCLDWRWFFPSCHAQFGRCFISPVWDQCLSQDWGVAVFNRLIKRLGLCLCMTWRTRINTYSTRQSWINWAIFEFIPASDSIILSRDGYHVLGIVKNIVRVSCMIPPKVRPITKECSVVCMQASKDFAQRGQPGVGPSYPLLETENSSDLAHYFLVKPATLFFVFL